MDASATEHTETTPLLSPSIRNRRHSRNNQPRIPHDVDVPRVLPYVERFHTRGLPADDSWLPQSPSAGVDRAAFELAVLLTYKATLTNLSPSTGDVWEQWSEETKHAAGLTELETRIVTAWDAFLNVPRSCSEVERILWSSHELSEGSRQSVRVIDLHEYFPAELLSHRVIELSLLHTWQYNNQGRSTTTTTWIQVAKTVCAPRSLHLLDLVGFVAYLGILAHYVLTPPTIAVEALAGVDLARTVSIVLYSLVRVLQHWSSAQVPYLITAIAFLSSLPSSPLPNSMSYNAVLVALSLHILQLHLPYTPSPLYLLPFRQVLPLSILIWNGVANIYLPVLALFLPTLLLVLVMLSLSLADAMLTATSFASPLEARTAFLLLLLVLLFLLIFTIGMLILVHPFLSASNTRINPWDKYSKPLGLQARRRFISIVLTYTGPYIRAEGSFRTTILSRSEPWDVILFVHAAFMWLTVLPLPLLLVAIFLWDIVS